MAERDSQEKAGEYKIPRVEELKISEPGYVDKLDEGLEELKRLAAGERATIKSLYSGAYRTLAERLSEIKGLNVQSGRQIPEEVLEEAQRLIGINIDLGSIVSYMSYSVDKEVAKSKRRMRRLSERQNTIFDSVINDFMTSAKPYEKRLEGCLEAADGFRDAIEELTTVTQIRLDLGSKALHVYMARGDSEVYESHMDLSKTLRETPPIEESRYLSPDIFLEDESLEELKQKSKQLNALNANVFLVKNPSNKIPTKVLLARAILDYFDSRKEAREKQAENQRKGVVEGKTPVDAFVAYTNLRQQELEKARQGYQEK